LELQMEKTQVKAKKSSGKASKPQDADETSNLPTATLRRKVRRAVPGEASVASPPAPASEPPALPEKSAVAAHPPEPTPATTVNASFSLFDPDAKRVSLCGDFNGWAPDATPLKWREGGHWETTVALPPGRHEYKFLADGRWMPNPLARENVWNRHGTLNSVIEVRG
jgi:hypothetical protein